MATKSEILRSKNNSYSDTLRIEILKALEDLIIAAGGGGGGLAQEATLLSILNNMIASQDVEILLVRDTGAADIVVQQIREYDQGTGAWNTRYENVNGGAYVPVGPLEYLDPSSVLNLILSQNTSINNKLVTDTDDNAIAEGQTLPLSISELYGAWDGAWQRVNTDGSGNLSVSVNNSQLPTDAATETTLYNLATPLSGIPTSMVRATTPGTVSAGKRRVSFFNAGDTNANVLGAILKAGESVTFSSDGVRDTLTSISYDALTSELLITTVG